MHLIVDLLGFEMEFSFMGPEDFWSFGLAGGSTSVQAGQNRSPHSRVPQRSFETEKCGATTTRTR